jgi:hypothetical protein
MAKELQGAYVQAWVWVDLKPEERVTVDRYGVDWNLSADELCPECGQPDNVGDCDHTQLSPEEVRQLNT